MSAFLRLQKPEERILKCSAFRRQNKRSNQKSTHKVTCEKEAVHQQGCALPAGRERDAGIHILKREAQRHAGRDAAGKWYFWETW